MKRNIYGLENFSLVFWLFNLAGWAVTFFVCYNGFSLYTTLQCLLTTAMVIVFSTWNSLNLGDLMVLNTPQEQIKIRNITNEELTQEKSDFRAIFRDLGELSSLAGVICAFINTPDTVVFIILFSVLGFVTMKHCESLIPGVMKIDKKLMNKLAFKQFFGNGFCFILSFIGFKLITFGLDKLFNFFS